MIAQGEGFVLRHQSGGYFKSHLYSPGFLAGGEIPPLQHSYSLVLTPLEADCVNARSYGESFLQSQAWASVAEQWEVVARPGCACCGVSSYALRAAQRFPMYVTSGGYRCEKHRDRNPCAIEGCKRSTAAKGHWSTDTWLCGEHWRIACPVGSPGRRIYLRIKAQARKRGFKLSDVWSADLEARYWRIWRRILALGRARCAGDIDMDEINKLFGWDEAA